MPGTVIFSPQTGDLPISEIGVSLLKASSQAAAQAVIGVSGGSVASVNGQTGVVVLDAADVSALPDTTTIPAASSTNPVVAGTAAPGVATTYARGDHVHPAQTSVTGNAGTATALATGRTFSLTDGATGTSAAFTGAANASISVALATPTASLRGGVLQQSSSGITDVAGLVTALIAAGVLS
ncbi:hypothetical protein [Rhizobium rhizogenes]|uniref:hypothetical protein n=1 Tax=Rhizobium rhizogenes TaxID=359 RepID=UPI000690455B|nr:hypothetical protein [Rhizobium rhizogenes]NTI80452.1 hypothetical protein [Rhizobium rhizogenes]NTJ22638.1 hypothetical protein [Rhizobium rhizogenes]QUE81341.1 hypothetical protein EML492_05915 [Rhizobium rhizogenes]TQO80563.1 hypothetical protein FFE80_05525 [Rhizobium rhizogenes]TRB52522.1 hypothetical protein EXN69_23025 [Rhizobium rhizogenes]